MRLSREFLLPDLEEAVAISATKSVLFVAESWESPLPATKLGLYVADSRGTSHIAKFPTNRLKKRKTCIKKQK